MAVKNKIRRAHNRKKTNLLQKLNPKNAGIAVGLILLVSVFAVFVLSPATEKSLTGWASATQTVSYLKAGNELFFEVKVDGVKDLTLTFSKDVKNAAFVTEEVNAVSWDFNGVAYSRFKVSSDDADKVSKAKFTLKIKPTELEKVGIAATDLKLYWKGEEVQTKMTKQEGNYAYYTAETAGIGEFVLGKAVSKAKEKVLVTELPEPKTPEETITPELEVSSEEPIPEETTVPLPGEEELPLVEKATFPEDKGFFGQVSDFLKGLFE